MSKLDRKIANRERKLATWGNMPRRERRWQTTAGMRDTARMIERDARKPPPPELARIARHVPLLTPAGVRNALATAEFVSDVAKLQDAGKLPPLQLSTVTGRFPSKSPPLAMPPSKHPVISAAELKDMDHAKFVKRSEAARKAAATRKANREAKA